MHTQQQPAPQTPTLFDCVKQFSDYVRSYLPLGELRVISEEEVAASMDEIVEKLKTHMGLGDAVARDRQIGDFMISVGLYPNQLAAFIQAVPILKDEFSPFGSEYVMWSVGEAQERMADEYDAEQNRLRQKRRR